MKFTSSLAFQNYKDVQRNAIIGDLHRMALIASNSINKVAIIKCKFKTAGYPDRFITVSSKYASKKTAGIQDFTLFKAPKK